MLGEICRVPKEGWARRRRYIFGGFGHRIARTVFFANVWPGVTSSVRRSGVKRIVNGFRVTVVNSYNALRLVERIIVRALEC